MLLLTSTYRLEGVVGTKSLKLRNALESVIKMHKRKISLRIFFFYFIKTFLLIGIRGPLFDIGAKSPLSTSPGH